MNYYEESPTEGFTFGMRLGCVREDHELNIAAMARSVGVSPSTWSKYENDLSFPSPQTIAKFCSIYHVNEEWLDTNYGKIYEDGYTPGDPLGKPVDYEKILIDEISKFNKQAWKKSVGQENYEKLEKALGSLKKGKYSMTNTELTVIRESLKLTKGELAKKLDVSPMILGRYEKGSLAIPEAVAERVKGMVESKDTPVVPAKKSRKGAVKKDTAAKVDEKPVEEKVATPATADEPRKPAKSRRKKSATPTLIIQSLLGGTITPEEITARIPDDVDTVYIKPEENKAYWVRGDETGSITLW